MSAARRVVVLAGGLTVERDVSLRSGRRVVDAFRAVGVDAEMRDVDGTLLATLAEHPPDAVFVALHGAPGEDGAVREVLDLAGVAYGGSGPAACRLAFDKPVASALVRAAGGTVPGSVVLPHETFRELGAQAVLERLVHGLGLPLVVKPTRGGSALGLSVVRSVTDLPAAMVHCFSYGETAVVEQYVAGTEVAVTVIEDGAGPRALAPVEIVPKEGLFDYAARYTAGATDYYVPARLADEVLHRTCELALLAHRVLGLRDVSRTDAIVRPDGQPVFLEVNVSPGMTETSLLPMAVEAAELRIGDVCCAILERAMSRR